MYLGSESERPAGGRRRRGRREPEGGTVNGMSSTGERMPGLEKQRMLERVAQNGRALRYAAAELQGGREIVLAAVAQKACLLAEDCARPAAPVRCAFNAAVGACQARDFPACHGAWSSWSA